MIAKIPARREPGAVVLHPRIAAVLNFAVTASVQNEGPDYSFPAHA